MPKVHGVTFVNNGTSPLAIIVCDMPIADTEGETRHGVLHVLSAEELAAIEAAAEKRGEERTNLLINNLERSTTG